MATRIFSVDSSLTSLTADCALLAYDVLDHPKLVLPLGLNFVQLFTGRNPSYFKNSVENYGFIASVTAEPDTYLIAFRGTDSYMDIYEDIFAEHADFVPYRNTVNSGVEVAAGFMGVYSSPVTKGGNDSMQNQLFDFISEKKPKNIIITGHSLGSSLAELFSLDVRVSTPSLGVRHYNYACPRTGNAAFANLYNHLEASLSKRYRTVRMVNYWDEIPCLPFELMGYKHGPDYFLIAFFKHGSVLKADYGIQHSMYNYRAVLDLAIKNNPQGCFGTVVGYKSTFLHSDIPDLSRSECQIRFDESTSEKEGS